MTTEEGQKLLAGHRVAIDVIDLRILGLLNERTRIVEQIGAVKRECALPVYEPKREEAVFSNVIDHNTGPLPPDSVRRIFERIVDEMRTLQKQQMQNIQQRGV
jgi:chorismate mutase-like protein